MSRLSEGLDDVLEATARFAGALDLQPILAVHPPSARDAMAARAPLAIYLVYVSFNCRRTACRSIRF